MRPVPDTYCSYHSQVTVGSFIHDVWESLGILDFWWKVVNTLAGLTGVLLPMDPAVHLLNDKFFSHRRSTRWLARGPNRSQEDLQSGAGNLLTVFQTLIGFLDMSYQELSSARINDAGPDTILMWTNLISDLKDSPSKQDCSDHPPCQLVEGRGVERMRGGIGTGIEGWGFF